LCGIAFIANYQNDFATMKRASEEALDLARVAGDDYAIAYSLDLLCLSLFKHGEADSIRSLAEEGLKIARQLESPWLMGLSLHCLGDVAFAAQDFKTAAPLFQESIDVWREGGINIGPSYNLIYLGDIDQLEGRVEQARAKYVEALRVFGPRKEWRGIAGIFEKLALLAIESVQGLHAARLFGAAESVRKRVGMPP